MENIVAKGEIARFEQFLVLSNFFFCHYVFKKVSAAETSESVYMREKVIRLIGERCSVRSDLAGALA